MNLNVSVKGFTIQRGAAALAPVLGSALAAAHSEAQGEVQSASAASKRRGEKKVLSISASNVAVFLQLLGPLSCQLYWEFPNDAPCCHY